MVRKLFENPWQAARLDEIEPFIQGVLGMSGIGGIAKPLLNPSDHRGDLCRFAPQDFRDYLVHLIRALVNDLMPVHSPKLTTFGGGWQRSARPAFGRFEEPESEWAGEQVSVRTAVVRTENLYWSLEKRERTPENRRKSNQCGPPR